MRVIHGYAQSFTERKRSKKKEERPGTAFFFSSNDNGNDHLKSGLPWSEQPGAPKTLFNFKDNRALIKMLGP